MANFLLCAVILAILRLTLSHTPTFLKSKDSRCPQSTNLLKLPTFFDCAVTCFNQNSPCCSFSFHPLLKHCLTFSGTPSFPATAGSGCANFVREKCGTCMNYDVRSGRRVKLLDGGPLDDATIRKRCSDDGAKMQPFHPPSFASEVLPFIITKLETETQRSAYGCAGGTNPACEFRIGGHRNAHGDSVIWDDGSPSTPLVHLISNLGAQNNIDMNSTDTLLVFRMEQSPDNPRARPIKKLQTAPMSVKTVIFCGCDLA